MSEDKVKRLNLMRFWLFGTFVIVWAATFTFTYLWVAPVSSSIMDVVLTALPVWIITAVLAIVWYFGYKWWLGREDGEMTPAAAEPSVAAASAAAPDSAASPGSPEASSLPQSSEGGSEG